MKAHFAALLLAATTLAANAQQATPASQVMPKDKTQSSPRLNPVQARAERLSRQMARDLRLNGYQASRLRAINEDKVAKMAAIERKHAGNAKLVDEQCQGVCRERDQELQAVLTSSQYTNYFDARARYYKFDRDYAANAPAILMAEAIQNPAPARPNDAVIVPASDKEATRTVGSQVRTSQP